MSEALKILGKKEFDFLSKGSVLPNSSETSGFNQNPINIQNSKRETVKVNLRDWFGGHRDIEAEEQVIGLGGYGKTLTIISASDDFDDDENEDDANWNRTMKRHY